MMRTSTRVISFGRFLTGTFAHTARSLDVTHALGVFVARKNPVCLRSDLSFATRRTHEPTSARTPPFPRVSRNVSRFDAARLGARRRRGALRCA